MGVGVGVCAYASICVSDLEQSLALLLFLLFSGWRSTQLCANTCHMQPLVQASPAWTPHSELGSPRDNGGGDAAQPRQQALLCTLPCPL